MSETMLAVEVEHYPEAAMTVDEVLSAIDETKKRLSRLQRRRNELQSDKRKIPDPIRDVKIAANRSYQWARRDSCDAEEARVRAYSAATTNAMEKISGQDADDVRVKEMAATMERTGGLPVEIVVYIENEFIEYNMTAAEKQEKRKAERKAAIATRRQNAA